MEALALTTLLDMSEELKKPRELALCRNFLVIADR
jgi:hypothetical protein